MKRDFTAAFLGRGWASPPTFVKGPNVALMNEGGINVNQNLMNLLNTHMGERPFKAMYGTNLSKVLFKPQTAIPQGELVTFLKAAIERYEPRIKVEALSLEMENQPNSRLLIKLSYVLISVNSRHNFVYPFYLNEGTHLELT